MKGARVLQRRMWSSPLLIMCRPRIIYLFWFGFDDKVRKAHKDILTKSDDFTYLGKDIIIMPHHNLDIDIP